MWGLKRRGTFTPRKSSESLRIAGWIMLMMALLALMVAIRGELG